MNRLRIFFISAGFGLMSLLSIGCPYDGPHYPTTYGVPTSTPTPAPLTAAVTAVTASLTFSPSTVTIMHGGAVTFALSGAAIHTLYIDNGAGACAQTFLSYPQTITFLSSGTFNFHCSNHSPCGTTVCTACTGMVGTVVVQ